MSVIISHFKDEETVVKKVYVFHQNYLQATDPRWESR